MWNMLLGPILGIGDKVIDRLWPDPAEKAKAKLELIKLEQEGAFKEVENQLAAIMAEANSKDPWTSCGTLNSSICQTQFSLMKTQPKPIDLDTCGL